MKDLYTLIEEYGTAENLAGFIEGMQKDHPINAAVADDLRKKKHEASQLLDAIFTLIGKPGATQ